MGRAGRVDRQKEKTGSVELCLSLLVHQKVGNPPWLGP